MVTTRRVLPASIAVPVALRLQSGLGATERHSGLDALLAKLHETAGRQGRTECSGRPQHERRPRQHRRRSAVLGGREGKEMDYRNPINAIVLVGALGLTVGSAFAWDDSKYPDFSGQWHSFSGAQLRFYAPNQKAPLTPEYQAIYDATKSVGGQGTNNMTYLCYSPGMPRAANGYGEIEFVIAPTTFHILVDHIYDNRRIFTDGRPWPDPIVPTLLGYSIGQWVDADGDGKYDVLEAETRGFRGPRAFDANGLPLHRDNETVIRERFYIDG